jgi:hypothetical protein
MAQNLLLLLKIDFGAVREGGGWKGEGAAGQGVVGRDAKMEDGMYKL